jgi:hypothetical protein
LCLCALSARPFAGAARAEDEAREACIAALHTNDGPIARMDEEQVAALLQFVGDSLRDQRLGASLWYAGWSAFNVANVAVGAAMAASATRRLERDRWLMSTTGAGIFLLGAFIMPLPGLYANLRMHRLPEATPGERRKKLQRGLVLLESAARAEDRNSNLVAHLVGLGFSLFGAGYIYFHNPHAPRDEVWLATGVFFAASVAGAEATLWSAPRKARRDLARTKQRVCGEATSAAQAEATRPRVAVSAGLGAVGLRWHF